MAKEVKGLAEEAREEKAMVMEEKDLVEEARDMEEEAREWVETSNATTVGRRDIYQEIAQHPKEEERIKEEADSRVAFNQVKADIIIIIIQCNLDLVYCTVIINTTPIK